MLKDAKLDGAKVRVFFTTLPFVDNVWVPRKQLDVNERDKFGEAFLALRDIATAWSSRYGTNCTRFSA